MFVAEATVWPDFKNALSPAAVLEFFRPSIFQEKITKIGEIFKRLICTSVLRAEQIEGGGSPFQHIVGTRFIRQANKFYHNGQGQIGCQICNSIKFAALAQSFD